MKVQVPVRQHMYEGLQLLLHQLPIAPETTHKSIPGLDVREDGHAVHSRPDPCWRAALQPDAALAIAQDRLDELQMALNAVAHAGGKPSPVVVKAVTDKQSARRSAAAQALCAGPLDEKLMVVIRKALTDKDLAVRAKTALALAALLIAHFSGALPGNSRLAGEISRFDFSGFDATAKAMGQAFNPYARDSAQTAHAILFFGSLALIPWKLLWKFGPFLLPLLFFARSPARPVATARYSLLAVAFVCHTLVLAVFVLRMQFVSGRYLGPLLLFATPFVALGLMSLLDRLPRWRWGVIALCVVLALANVTSLGGAKKRQFRDAGQWLAAQAKVEDPSIFLASARTAHYAGWRFSTRAGKELDRDKLSAEVAAGRYRLVILEVSRKDPDFGDWLTRSGLREVRRFPGDSGEAVVVAEPLRDGASPPQGSRAQP